MRDFGVPGEVIAGRAADHPGPLLNSLSAWRQVFAASRDDVDVVETCPVCGRQTLHRWFYLERAMPTRDAVGSWQGRGSEWQWCSSCRSYEHYVGLVPDWWAEPFTIDLEELYEDPGPIEDARLQHLSGWCVAQQCHC